jgi:hypothetical protein
VQLRLGHLKARVRRDPRPFDRGQFGTAGAQNNKMWTLWYSTRVIPVGHPRKENKETQVITLSAVRHLISSPGSVCGLCSRICGRCSRICGPCTAVGVTDEGENALRAVPLDAGLCDHGRSGRHRRGTVARRRPRRVSQSLHPTRSVREGKDPSCSAIFFAFLDEEAK